MHILKRYRWRAIASVLGVFLVGYALLFAPPSIFPSGKIFVVNRGESAAHIAQTFADAHLVAHATMLNALLRIMGVGNTVQAGAYSFANPESVLTIALRLSVGDYGIPPKRITLYEGMTVRDLAARVASALPEITADDMLAAGKNYEGYLFPDTYIFAPGADADAVIATMRANFTEKIAPLSGAIGSSGHSLSEIITMASLIEKEARTVESKRVIAGILWRRIAIGMPLQVDAVFGHIFNRDTYSPSYKDLKVDSPYNTYTHKGLPPGPIDNPGLDSIEAALNPTKTPYLYYLTGRDNQMHYASTYDGHLANQRKYLSVGT